MLVFPVRKVSEKRASLGLTVKTRLVEGRGRVTGKIRGFELQAEGVSSD